MRPRCSPILTTLILHIPLIALCQSPFSSKADSLRAEGHMYQALSTYVEQYKKAPKDILNIRKYAEALALNGDIDSAFFYLNLIIEQDTSVDLLVDPDFFTLIEDKRWEQLQNVLVSNVEAKYAPYPNLELSKRLWTMFIKDQAFYYHLGIVEKRSEYEYFMGRALWDLKLALHKENLQELDEIVADSGWPESSVVGEVAASAAFLVVQHSTLEAQKKYLPLMKAAAEAGEAKWSSLPYLIDRINLAENKEQIYGSQVSCNFDGSGCHFPRLKDPEFVNQRRKEVGLGPIEEYAASCGIEWTIEQKNR